MREFLGELTQLEPRKSRDRMLRNPPPSQRRITANDTPRPAPERSGQPTSTLAHQSPTPSVTKRDLRSAWCNPCRCRSGSWVCHVCLNGASDVVSHARSSTHYSRLLIGHPVGEVRRCAAPRIVSRRSPELRRPRRLDHRPFYAAGRPGAGFNGVKALVSTYEHGMERSFFNGVIKPSMSASTTWTEFDV